jgi:hypothetical protein
MGSHTGAKLGSPESEPLGFTVTAANQICGGVDPSADPASVAP